MRQLAGVIVSTVIAAGIAIGGAPAQEARAADAVVRTWAPCASDEWPELPGRPCVWDARHMGNGYGHSFFVHPNGDVTYIPHRRAHRMLSLGR